MCVCVSVCVCVCYLGKCMPEEDLHYLGSLSPSHGLPQQLLLPHAPHTHMLLPLAQLRAQETQERRPPHLILKQQHLRGQNTHSGGAGGTGTFSRSKNIQEHAGGEGTRRRTETRRRSRNIQEEQLELLTKSYSLGTLSRSALCWRSLDSRMVSWLWEPRLRERSRPPAGSHTCRLSFSSTSTDTGRGDSRGPCHSHAAQGERRRRGGAGRRDRFGLGR